MLFSPYLKVQMYQATLVRITQYHLSLIPCVATWSLAWISTALNKMKKDIQSFENFPNCKLLLWSLIRAIKLAAWPLCVMKKLGHIQPSGSTAARQTKCSFKKLAVVSGEGKFWRPPWSWSKASYCVFSFQLLYTFDPQMTK